MGQNSYTASFKLKVVAYASAQSKRAAAKYFRVDRRRMHVSFHFLLSILKGMFFDT
jgi:hypothetical protein